jgi:hypothetical protein
VPRELSAEAARRALLRAQSEDDVLGAVFEGAELGGWWACHFRPARMANGEWRTPVQGRKGFVDTVLVRGPELLLWELKTETGRVRPEQGEWLYRLSGVQVVETAVIRPRDLPQARARLLRGGPK